MTGNCTQGKCSKIWRIIVSLMQKFSLKKLNNQKKSFWHSPYILNFILYLKIIYKIIQNNNISVYFKLLEYGLDLIIGHLFKKNTNYYNFVSEGNPTILFLQLPYVEKRLNLIR